MTGHPREQLMAYADGELGPAEAAEIDQHLQMCTECARELAILRNLKGAMQDMNARAQKDLWGGVHRRLTTPVAWLLIAIGSAVWIGLAVFRWFQSELTIEWLAATAIGTGLVMLLIAVGQEQYRHWKSDRYKDVER